MAGVSIRALHHYDAIGLLRPAGSTEAAAVCTRKRTCGGLRSSKHAGVVLAVFHKEIPQCGHADPGLAFKDVLYVLDADDLLTLVVLDVLAIEFRNLLAMRVPKVLALDLAKYRAVIGPNSVPVDFRELLA